MLSTHSALVLAQLLQTVKENTSLLHTSRAVDLVERCFSWLLPGRVLGVRYELFGSKSKSCPSANCSVHAPDCCEKESGWNFQQCDLSVCYVWSLRARTDFNWRRQQFFMNGGNIFFFDWDFNGLLTIAASALSINLHFTEDIEPFCGMVLGTKCGCVLCDFYHFVMGRKWG